MPIVDVELKRDVPRARRGYVKYAATAIAAILFLHGAATFALHHHLHDNHSIDGDQDRPPPLESADAQPPPEHAPAAAAHAAAERLKAKPDHKPDGGRPQAPKKPPAKSRKAPNLWQPPARGTKVPLDPPPRPPLPVLGDGTALRRADAPEVYDAIDDATVAQRVLPCVEINHQCGHVNNVASMAWGARNLVSTQVLPQSFLNRERAAQITKTKDIWGDESIFVSVASYRDPEIAKTVARAFERAADPDRVFFGIFQQNDESKDVDAVRGLAPLITCPGHAACGRVRNGQIRIHRIAWKDTLGPTVARHLSETLYENETYVISFDSHTNFAHGWDVIAIDMFKRINNPRAIVTTYPASYSATEHSERWKDVDEKGPCEACRKVDDQANVDVPVLSARQMSICRTRRVAVGRTTSFKHDVNSMQRPPKPTLVPFLAAGFNFASGRRILEVPYDAHSAYLFDGEETSLAVRAWTHGYDFYHPDRDIVSHLYIPNKSPLRPVFWTQDWSQRARVQFWTMLRINYLLGLHDLLDYWVNATLLDTRDATIYGLGTRRRAVDYWSYVGVTPDRDGVEWSPGRCKVFSTTGLPAFPVDAPGSHNDYSKYAESFPSEAMAEATVDANYARQFL